MTNDIFLFWYGFSLFFFVFVVEWCLLLSLGRKLVAAAATATAQLLLRWMRILRMSHNFCVYVQATRLNIILLRSLSLSRSFFFSFNLFACLPCEADTRSCPPSLFHLCPFFSVYILTHNTRQHTMEYFSLVCRHYTHQPNGNDICTHKYTTSFFKTTYHIGFSCLPLPFCAVEIFRSCMCVCSSIIAVYRVSWLVW